MMRAVLFDKDGTLMQFVPFWAAVADKALSALSLRLGAPERAAALKAAVGLHGDAVAGDGVLCAGTYAQMAEIVRRLFPETGASVTAEDMKTLFREFSVEGKILPVCDNLRGTLETLCENGFLLFAVTTDSPQITKLCLAGLGIADLFEEVFCDDGKLPAKPDPAAIRTISERYAIPPQGMCMVGDTATDIKFARAGGVRVVCVGDAAGADDYLKDVSGLPALLNVH